MKILIEHDDYQITFHPGGAQAEKLVCTFGGQPSGLDRKGFGTDFALSRGYSTIYIAQRHGTQYQKLPLDVFRDAILPMIDGYDVFAYGSSLGAWAALWYGGTINARIIAAAPMLPAHPALRNSAYTDIFVNQLDLRDAPAGDHPPLIFYDPERPPDRIMVEDVIMPARKSAQIIPLPFAGHTILVTLSAAGLLKDVICGVIERHELIPFDLPTQDSAIWHREKGRAMSTKDTTASIEHLRQSLSIAPEPSTVSMLLTVLLKAGQTGEAQELVYSAIRSSDRRMKLVPSAAKRARDAGLNVPL